MSDSEPVWAGIYTLAGTMEFSNGWTETAVELPTTMSSSYDPSARTLLFFGKTESGPGLWYGFGLNLHLSNAHGDEVRRVSLITPRSGGGTVTFTFPTAERVRWLSLRPDEVAASKTTDEKYMLSIRRLATSEWAVTLVPLVGEEPYAWFTRGTFEIHASSPHPPWDEVTIEFSVESKNGDANGRLRLQRIER